MISAALPLLHAVAAAGVFACPPSAKLGATAPALAEASPAERMAFIRNRMEIGAAKARRHTLGWGIGLGILSVAQFALVPLIDRQARPDFLVGGTAAGIGALSRLVFMPSVIRERRKLAKVRGHSCPALAAAERALVKSAKSERFGHSIGMHALALGYNAAVGLTLGLGFKRPIEANVLAAGGSVIGAIMLYTQPHIMDPALTTYRTGTRLTLLTPR